MHNNRIRHSLNTYISLPIFYILMFDNVPLWSQNEMAEVGLGIEEAFLNGVGVRQFYEVKL